MNRFPPNFGCFSPLFMHSTDTWYSNPQMQKKGFFFWDITFLYSMEFASYVHILGSLVGSTDRARILIIHKSILAKIVWLDCHKRKKMGNIQYKQWTRDNPQILPTKFLARPLMARLFNGFSQLWKKSSLSLMYNYVWYKEIST